jgi:hypothetical protein
MKTKEIEKLSKENKDIYDELITFYKFVNICDKCNKLFGTDKNSEKLCFWCDENYKLNFKNRIKRIDE